MQSTLKKFLIGLLVLFGLGVICGVWSFFIEPDMLIVNRQTVSIKGWPEELKGYKIAIIADIHAGSPYIDEQKIKELTELTNAQKPDLILLLGDYVIHGVKGGKFMTPAEMMKELKHLKAPDGVVAIIGNHDWWYNGREVWKELIYNDFYVLENDYLMLPNSNPSFVLAGLADLDTRAPDVKEFVDILPEGKPIIMMSHSPDVFPDVSEKIGLTLAGHTHGGQVRIPFYGSISVPSRYKDRYAKGLVVEEGRKLFVSSGIGTSILPVRFNCPPEIVVMTVNPE